MLFNGINFDTYFKNYPLSIELSSQFEKKLVVIYVWVHFWT